MTSIGQAPHGPSIQIAWRLPFPDPPVGRLKPQKAIDGALAHVAGGKYQVPVLPSAQLQELMHGLGDGRAQAWLIR
jgi:hypothetical protein